jgi:hypothetical protein
MRDFPSSLVYAYWILFGIAIVALIASAGLFLMLSAVLVLPVLLVHLTIGFRLALLKRKVVLVLCSAINMLLFALVRPDGVHVINQSGLTELLDIIGVHFRIHSEYEGLFALLALILFVIQVVLELVLLYSTRRARS